MVGTCTESKIDCAKSSLTYWNQDRKTCSQPENENTITVDNRENDNLQKGLRTCSCIGYEVPPYFVSLNSPNDS